MSKNIKAKGFNSELERLGVHVEVYKASGFPEVKGGEGVLVDFVKFDKPITIKKGQPYEIKIIFTLPK